MKKALIAAIILSILLTPLLAEAQAPTPPNVPTLGPVIICSAGDGGTNVRILSPQNQSYSNNQIQLNFSVKAVGMFGQFGNVGYSLDGGIINSVSNFVNKSVDNVDTPDWYWNRTTVFASIVLPQLSEGIHNVSVYYGWQYLGIPENPSLQRFEVFAYATVNFTVINSNALPTDENTNPSTSISTTPTPAVAEFSSWTLLLLLTVMMSTGFLVYFKKHKR
jgi:hypothetical protein